MGRLTGKKKHSEKRCEEGADVVNFQSGPGRIDPSKRGQSKRKARGALSPSIEKLAFRKVTDCVMGTVGERAKKIQSIENESKKNGEKKRQRKKRGHRVSEAGGSILRKEGVCQVMAC